jgi:predicted metal-dependent hydrolase
LKSSGKVLTRSIEINKENISYKLRYSQKAKYMRLQITSYGGLEIILPRGYEIKDGETFITKKINWIKRNLSSKKNNENNFLLFGEKIKVQQSFELFLKRHRTVYRNDELHIVSPQGNNDNIIKIYEAWLKYFSKFYFLKRTQELAKNFDFKIGKITIRSQKTRWGSASARGNLSFNYRLLKFRREVIDYVIIHELCHLKEMNHSKKFWLLVEEYCPDYKALRKELKGKK